ncbi:MAG TPA: D-alanine--D-alanine ligase family protein [Polyangiaceae bacterium]|nr:D-alanine--D-alanine ligase family protein [Polyangiaceae bacterium]
MSSERPLRVAVLCGGQSQEHEISLLSARFVLEGLDPSRFEAVLVGIGKDGVWRLQAAAHLLAAPPDPRRISLDAGMPEVMLRKHGAGARLECVGSQAAGTGGLELPAVIDVVFPVLHGPMGEDGTLQGLLELCGVPYVGGSVIGSAIGMDKDVMKRLLLQAGLPVLPYRTVKHADFVRAPLEIERELGALGLPVFVKPANLGSSVGVRRVASPEQLRSALEHAFEFDDKLVVEAGLVAPREIVCAVIGGAPARVSQPGEIVVDHPDGFYSYAAKYLDDFGVQTRIPAALAPDQTERARTLALATFEALEGRGLARVDLFVSQRGELYVNEINTLPGMTRISMFPKLWEHSGIGGRELVSLLIEDARLRSARRKRSA